MTVNLSEKLALQLALHKDPIVMMSQIRFKACFPSIWPVPAANSTYKDPVSGLDIIIDNNVPHDRIDITDRD